MATIQQVKDVLANAVECDQGGQIFQAISHYAEGTRLLMHLVDREDVEQRQSIYYDSIKQYIERSEDIKHQVKMQVANSKHEARFLIPKKSTNNGYEKVFGRYLNDRVHEILLEEPLLDEKYHFQNLTIFFELVVRKCPCINYVRITTRPSQRDKSYQVETFEGIKEDMDRRLILLDYVIDNFHIEPKIILNTGYIIKLSRGLHYFQFPCALFNLGLCDYNLRKCLETTIDIYKTDPFTA